MESKAIASRLPASKGLDWGSDATYTRPSAVLIVSPGGGPASDDSRSQLAES
jgi:hypothetical protein